MPPQKKILDLASSNSTNVKYAKQKLLLTTNITIINKLCILECMLISNEWLIANSYFLLLCKIQNWITSS